MEKEINYLYAKLPLMISDRDIVQEKKTWPIYNGDPETYLDVTKSVTHPKYPPTDDAVRAEKIIGGTYLKVKSPKETLMYMINHCDLKFTTGGSIVNSKAPKSMKEFIENLTDYLGKISKKK